MFEVSLRERVTASLMLPRARHNADLCLLSKQIRCYNNRRSATGGFPMKELVQFVAQQLVSHPEAVEVEETRGTTASLIALRVAKEDLGRVIGKQGRTVQSIRTILNAVASRTNQKIVLEIIE
jgi:predicted RNA-binding protein YlqC (UPF0109 family)